MKKFLYQKRRNAFFLTIGLVVSSVFSAVISTEFINPLVFIPIFIAYIVTKSASILTVQLATSVVVFGALMTVVSRIGFQPSAFHAQLAFICVFACTLYFVRKFVKIEIRNYFSEGSSIIIFLLSGFLAIRWPLETKLSQLAFLSYEDNAAWISTAAGFSINHSKGYVQGVGGYVLDPLMYLLYGIRRGVENTTSPLLSYTTVTASYSFLQFFAISTAGLWVLNSASKLKKFGTPVLVASIGCVGMAYVALQLPRSTGHLTFIGVLAFIWLSLLASTLKFQHVSSRTAVSFVLILGAVGMWWPYLAVVLVAIGYYVASNFKKIGSQLQSNRLSSRYLLLLPLLLIGGFIVLPILRDSFTSLSVREFLTVSGGVQGVPGNLLLFGVLGLFTYSTALRDNDQGKNALIPVLSLGIFVIVLYFSSVFTGPEFIPKYTYLKTLLLFALVLIPTIALATVDVVGRNQNVAHTALVGLLLFALGTSSTGWDVNNPRQFPVPRWAPTMLKQSEEDPQSYILCSTSDPDSNLESYICSRHAAALQNKDDDISGDWRYLQLYPSIDTPGNIERAQRLRANIDQKLRMNTNLHLLSFESDFAIAEEDKWWMTLLDLEKLKIVRIG